MKYEKIKNLVPAEFKRLCGVEPETFDILVDIVKKSDAEKKTKGRPNKLSPENKVLVTWEYLREYRTFFHIAQDWEIHESTAYRIVKRTEDILVKSNVFNLPGKKSLFDGSKSLATVVIDVTESPIERPKNKQSRYYSGKNKKHTLKTQIVADRETGEIICTNFDRGKKHDFQIFKESKLGMSENIKCLGELRISRD